MLTTQAILTFFLMIPGHSTYIMSARGPKEAIIPEVCKSVRQMSLDLGTPIRVFDIRAKEVCGEN